MEDEVNHDEAITKTDKALEKLYEPLYECRRHRKPVPEEIMNHFKRTGERLMSLLRTDREAEARNYYKIRKIEITKLFEILKD